MSCLTVERSCPRYGAELIAGAAELGDVDAAELRADELHDHQGGDELRDVDVAEHQGEPENRSREPFQRTVPENRSANSFSFASTGCIDCFASTGCIDCFASTGCPCRSGLFLSSYARRCTLLRGATRCCAVLHAAARRYTLLRVVA